MSVVIYHNPKCTKSRQTLALLNERGVHPEIIQYLHTPPNVEQLKNILKLLSMSPRDLMRTNEAIYKEKELDDETLNEEQLIAALIENPILIERPIVLANKKAAVCRPPENVLEIL